MSNDLNPNNVLFSSILYCCLGLLHLLIILIADYRLRQIKGRYQIDAGQTYRPVLVGDLEIRQSTCSCGMSNSATIYWYRAIGVNIRKVASGRLFRSAVKWLICKYFQKEETQRSITFQNWHYLYLQCILVFNLVNFAPTKYGDYVFPWYMDGLGWCMTIFTVSMIPAVAIYKLCNADRSLNVLQRVSPISG